MNCDLNNNEPENRNEILRKKVLDASTNTIMKRLEALRGASNEDKAKMRRRWIWELIQNAVDSSRESGVNIWIEYDKDRDFLEFSHDGKYFTYENIIDLITQISSKSDNEQNNIGKFGTGFISTHLISSVVNVEGYYQENKDSTRINKISFVLDRSGKTREEIKRSTELVYSNIDTLLQSDASIESVDDIYRRTSFRYNLGYSSADVYKDIEEGIADLDINIPFVFIFSDKIKEVHCNGYIYKKKKVEPLGWEGISYLVCEKVCISDGSKSGAHLISCSHKESLTTIAFQLQQNENLSIIKSMENNPKLFCTFPLIGTENFPFPIVVNSPFFQVLEEREGIHEGHETNIKIFEDALNLYSHTIDFLISDGRFKQIYNLCKLPRHTTEFQKSIENKIKSVYYYKPIVPVSGNVSRALFSHENSGDSKDIYIPYAKTKELIDDFWELVNDITLIKPIPIKHENSNWGEVSESSRIDITNILKSFEKNIKTIEQLQRTFKENCNCYGWLNRLYEFYFQVTNTDTNALNSSIFVPNQNEEFVIIKNMHIDDDIDEELKNILEKLGGGIKGKLLNKQITLPISDLLEKYSNTEVADRIYMKIKELQQKEASGEERNGEIQVIYNQLTDWFLRNPDNAKRLFKDIYDNQHLLSSREETIRRLELATTVEKVLDGQNIKLDRLEHIISDAYFLFRFLEDGKLPSDDDLRSSLNHISSTSPYAAEKINEMIERSIRNVHKKLVTISEYSIANTVEEWIEKQYSKTVFPAIKNGAEIFIIIRPSDGRKIIFYEETEIEALDSSEFELWIDDGINNPKNITLGEIIKTTGILKIPLYKIV